MRIDEFIAAGVLALGGTQYPVLLSGPHPTANPQAIPRRKGSARPVRDAVMEWAILECAATMSPPVGRHFTAAIVHGAQRANIVRHGGHKLACFGAVVAKQQRIADRIQRLIHEGVLRADSGGRKVMLPQGGVAPPRRPARPSGSIGAQFLRRSQPAQLALGGARGWALTSYFQPSGDSKTELGDLLQAFKYGQRHDRGELLADRLLDEIRRRPGLSQADALVPIPPSKQDRGFDPAVELARMIAKRGGPEALVGVLVKERPTQTQKNLRAAAARRANVADALKVADPGRVAGRRVIVLDDFVDSGATMAAAAQALKRAGAVGVVLLAVATTGREWT